ncbi:MAG: hypothetical protein KF861_18530, partial [Planctomycetaceae bacterium]|nr:hypothetical protein [Planctomycetaceae bacterium]
LDCNKPIEHHVARLPDVAEMAPPYALDQFKMSDEFDRRRQMRQRLIKIRQPASTGRANRRICIEKNFDVMFAMWAVNLHQSAPGD